MATHPQSSNTFSSLSKRWREDLRLIRDRANSFTWNLPATSPDEVDFVKNLRPKLSEFPRRTPKSRIRINLSSLREAIASEVEDVDGILSFDEGHTVKRFSCREFWREGDEDEQRDRDWKPIRVFKKQFQKNSEFLKKLKSSLVFAPVVMLVKCNVTVFHLRK